MALLDSGKEMPIRRKKKRMKNANKINPNKGKKGTGSTHFINIRMNN